MTATEAPTGLKYGDHGPSIRAFFASKAFIRVMLGGRGVGKTHALIEDITAHIWNNAGAKAIVARQTEASQGDSSIDSAWKYFEELGPVYSAGGLGLFKSWNNGRTFRLPSRLAIETMQRDCAHMTTRAEIAHWIITKGDPLCGYIEFRGLPDADKGKFRGMECSYFAIVEADQVAHAQFNLCLACLRWKGADPETCDDKGFIIDKCVVLDTNPPSDTHWIAEFEKEQAAKPEHERVAEFWHIPTHENAHNLPENYIRDQILLPYGNNQALLERYLYGRYADAWTGRPVFYAYNRQGHETEKLGWMRGATMIIGADVGTWNTSLISAFKQHDGHLYWWCLREIVLQDSDTERQALALLQTLSAEFPFWNQGNAICPEVYLFCDPAAANSNFSTGPTSNSVKIFASHGLHFSARMPDRGLQTSIATVNRLLEQHHIEKTPSGPRAVWHFKIDTKKCPKLTNALRGAYRYPEKGEVGYGTDLPLKGTLCEGADHSCFVAGTMVAAEFGETPIECLRVGDRVWTTGGLRMVVAVMAHKAETREYEFAGGVTTRSTPDHPYFVPGMGFVHVGKLSPNDPLLMRRADSYFIGQTTSPTTRTTVYNLTVEGEHEYFANGILVSNCDGLRYAVLNALSLAQEEHPPGMTSRTPETRNTEPKRRV